MTETQKHISVKNYQDIIIKEFASATKRKQKVYYQMALDEFISNHSKEIQEQGMNSNFLTKELKKDQLEEIPFKIKELFKLNLTKKANIDKLE